MGDGLFITIGGVRYHKDSVVQQSETTDESGAKRYNVTLEGGTQLSYSEQGKSSQGYNVEIFRRNSKALNTTVSKVNLGRDRRPLVLALKPMNDGRNVSISIFGLNNATITDNNQVGEDIQLTNCHNNILKFDGGNLVHGKTVENDLIDMGTGDHFKKSTNNIVYIDRLDQVTSDDSECWILDKFNSTDNCGNRVIQSDK